MTAWEDDNALDIDQVKRFYDWFGKRQDWQAFYEDEAVARMVEAGCFGEAHAVFELGCGTGRLAERLFASELSAQAHYVGVDVSTTMVELTRARLQRIGERARVCTGDGTDNGELTAGCFDRFISTYVLDLMDSQHIAAALAEAHRLLANDGLLCLVSLTHGRGAWGRLLEGAWMAAWRRAPDKLGGCRPIELLASLPRSRWRVRHHETVSAFGLSSEVVVASPA